MHKCDHLIFHIFKNTVKVFETTHVDILPLAITEDNMAIGSHIVVISTLLQFLCYNRIDMPRRNIYPRSKKIMVLQPKRRKWKEGRKATSVCLTASS